MRKQGWKRLAAAAAAVMLMTGCAGNSAPATTTAATTTAATTAAETTAQETEAKTTEAETTEAEAAVPDGALVIAKQGMFSSGGTVTEPVEGEYDETTNWLDFTRAGNTAHVDHANVLYQIPANDNGNPIVYLHGYGQSRMGWMTTPDGREGWSDIFLKNGHSA
ncbi:MAG: alpha/beta hydrolase, partial [bacterium]|nr:alpha/beta hydrolase [bacterium]